jgi:Flp pilus assembly pilin Flp
MTGKTALLRLVATAQRRLMVDAGQAMVEYALILTLVTLVAIGVLQALGIGVSGFLVRTGSSLSSVTNP